MYIGSCGDTLSYVASRTADWYQLPKQSLPFQGKMAHDEESFLLYQSGGDRGKAKLFMSSTPTEKFKNRYGIRTSIPGAQVSVSLARELP
jgi:hypothetical protein